MKLVLDNAQVARITGNFNYGPNKEHTAMNVVIIAPIKMRGQKGVQSGEYHCKTFNKKVMADIKKALEGSLYINLTGSIMYGRYEPKGVINTVTGQQHSQPQWDFLLETSMVVEHPNYQGGVVMGGKYGHLVEKMNNTVQPNYDVNSMYPRAIPPTPPTPPTYVPPQPVQPPVKPNFQTVNTTDYPANDYPSLDDIFND